MSHQILYVIFLKFHVLSSMNLHQVKNLSSLKISKVLKGSSEHPKLSGNKNNISCLKFYLKEIRQAKAL